MLGIRPDQKKGLFNNLVSLIRSDDAPGQVSRRRAVGAKRVAQRDLITLNDSLEQVRRGHGNRNQTRSGSATVIGAAVVIG